MSLLTKRPANLNILPFNPPGTFPPGTYPPGAYTHGVPPPVRTVPYPMPPPNSTYTNSTTGPAPPPSLQNDSAYQKALRVEELVAADKSAASLHAKLVQDQFGILSGVEEAMCEDKELKAALCVLTGLSAKLAIKAARAALHSISARYRAEMGQSFQVSSVVGLSSKFQQLKTQYLVQNNGRPLGPISTMLRVLAKAEVEETHQALIRIISSSYRSSAEQSLDKILQALGLSANSAPSSTLPNISNTNPSSHPIQPPSTTYSLPPAASTPSMGTGSPRDRVYRKALRAEALVFEDPDSASLHAEMVQDQLDALSKVEAEVADDEGLRAALRAISARYMAEMQVCWTVCDF